MESWVIALVYTPVVLHPQSKVYESQQICLGLDNFMGINEHSINILEW
jgi:hypothetical protein